MGGKMNLNPLKKDDNTDALVKALEDANSAGSVQPPVNPGMNIPDDATIAADPQIAAAGVTTPDPVVTPAADSIVAESIPSASPVADPVVETPEVATTPSTDTGAALSFDGNDDLPAGMSSDADAHLPTEGTGDNTELDGVKKSALEQLRPLIEKLDLEPADKFDKYLMMLRASDDPELIKPAFDAAQGISGEKEKAQALLDIINEINYITTNQQQA